MVTEFAKDKVWENNEEVFNNQAYIFGKQSFKISRCANKVDVVITDSPLPLSVFYNNDPLLTENFNASKGVIGVDKLLHHYNGRISRFGDDVEIKGYCGSGIAQYLYDYLSNKLPLDEMLETYEITPENFIAEITFLLDEIGISD